jgi:hypothetical protein
VSPEEVEIAMQAARDDELAKVVKRLRGAAESWEKAGSEGFAWAIRASVELLLAGAHRRELTQEEQDAVTRRLLEL